jgi:hypothetical protein
MGHNCISSCVKHNRKSFKSKCLPIGFASWFVVVVVVDDDDDDGGGGGGGAAAAAAAA